MSKAKLSPLYPTRHIFWERSKHQPQHCSLLNKADSTSWQKSYGTNSSDSISAFLFSFHILLFYFYFFFLLRMLRIIFHSPIFCCSQQCSAEMSVLAESPFTFSVNDTKYCGVQRIQVSIVSQDMCKLTPEMEKEVLNRPVFQCHWTNCTFKKYSVSKQPYLKPAHSLRAHLV